MSFLERNANRGSISTGYDVDNSVKLEPDNSEYFQRAATGSDGSLTTWTFSLWLKRTKLSHACIFYSQGGNGRVRFESDDTFRMASFGTLDTDPIVYKDNSGWYHFFIKNGTSDGTGAIYVNGVQQTLSTNTWGNQGYFVNGSNIQIGASNNGTYMFDGYIAEVNAFYDQTKDHTDFGEFKNGIWIPKEYSGSFGNSRDFQLKFLQTGTSQNSSGIGADTSGNDNHFSVVNMGADHVVLDSPTFGD